MVICDFPSVILEGLRVTSSWLTPDQIGTGLSSGKWVGCDIHGDLVVQVTEAPDSSKEWGQIQSHPFWHLPLLSRDCGIVCVGSEVMFACVFNDWLWSCGSKHVLLILKLMSDKRGTLIRQGDVKEWRRISKWTVNRN